MIIKEHSNGKDVWMDSEELDYVLRKYEIGGDRWLALSLQGRCGLKNSEVMKIQPSDLITNHTPRLLQVESVGAINSLRQVPVPDDVAATLNTKKEHRGRNNNDTKDNPVVDVNPRTVRDWAKRYVDELIEERGENGWKHLSPKSFRQSWANILLNEGIPPQTVMNWGGWHHPENFHDLFISNQKKSDFSQIYETTIFNSKPPSNITSER